MNFQMLLTGIGILAVTSVMAQTAGAAEAPLDAMRVKNVEAMLSEKPQAVGRPISDRALWDSLKALPAYNEPLTRVEKLLSQPLPEQPDDLYLEFSRNGNRTRWQAVASQRRSRLAPLVLAECLENKGRFLPPIEQLIKAVSAERTWVMPAHDAGLKNFNGTVIDIDLASSALGWNLAVADYLIGERLSGEVRTLLRGNVQKRIITPYRDMYSGRRPVNWWMVGTNNWNSVCLAGVTGAGLALLESKTERAEFVVAAEKYSRFFLSGFTPDGYCSEGLGYWNYGFGHYVLLSETVHQATSGKVDLMAVPEAKMPATFGERIQIINGISPAFADCGVFAKPAPALMNFLTHRFALGAGEYEKLDAKNTFSTLFEAMIYGLPNSATLRVSAANAKPTKPLRDWFEQAGILISRPAPGSATSMAVALKGGHNAEHHNHNDLGSYVVVIGERPVLLDPGNETYTARTFSKNRYDGKLLNSYGHPVPIVGKVLQKEGRQSEARVLRTDFKDNADTIQFDLASAYPLPDLKKLERTFVYSRAGTGSLAVSDHVQFKTPQAFGTTVLTLGSWQRAPDGSLMIYDIDEAVRVEVDSGGRAWTVDAEEIREDAPVVPTRLGINLKDAVEEATITLKITPLAPVQLTGNGLLRNGSFEAGNWGWQLPRDGMGSVSTEKALTGTSSLKISDTVKDRGSNVVSSRIAVQAGQKYQVRGQVFRVSGGGIGLYVRYLNAHREMINPTTGGSNITPVGTIEGKNGSWQPFSFGFTPPPETSSIQLWIHSFNGTEVESYLDDLEVVPEP